MRFCKYFGLLGASTLAYAAPAFCQIAADRAAAPDEPQNADIVVTGTLIRGVEPTGTTVIGIDRSAVEASGATTVTQLLQTVPQFGSFNTAQAPQGGGTTVTTNRPNLRDLASSNTNGASATLLLIDGHRVVGMGIQTTSPDLDTIAPGAIERVDVVPDGGSSIYGADAVGGVVNFITRKTFSGLGVDGRFGFADEYRSWDVNATVGTTWTGGGVYASYNYSKHDAIFGRDRDWVRQFPTQSAAFAVPVIGVECKTPNVQIVNNPNIYGLPLVPTAAARLNQPNQCDYSDFATVYPKERRHAVFASLTQELSDSLDFELKGFFMDRKQRAVTGYLRATKNLGTSPGQLNSPFRSQFIINSATESQRVSFGFGADDANRQEIHLQTWGVTPTFTARLGGNWQARVLLNYGESTTTVHSPTFNDPALNNAITAGLFNPYNPASSNSAASAAISNFEVFGQAKQSQLQARAVLDGDLFELPGGAVKLAVGGEFLHETLRTQKGNAVPGFQTTGFSGQSINGSLIVPAQARLPILHASREVKSVFGELVVPLLADTALFQELTLSASGRYDDYSDFGDTFNPKFGLTWKPFDRLRIRGQWGKSFSAPSLANSADADPATATWSTGSIFNIFVSAAGINALKARGYPAPTAANSTILTLGGGSNGLKPQTATTWSLGADLDPFAGARLSVTYWNIKFKDLIASPVGTAASNPANYFNQFLSSYIINPTQADIQGLLSQATIVNGSPCSSNTALQPACLYILEFNTTQNLGKFNKEGIDFVVSYEKEFGFGSIDFTSAGTYLLTRKQSVSATAPLVDQIKQGQSRLQMRTSLGTRIERFRAQGTWNHTAGYQSSPGIVGLPPFYPDQNRIGAFDTFDLFFKYDFEGSGVMKDLALTLSINNVFDADAPVRYVGGSVPAQFGFTNGSTIGRLVQVGFSKKF